MEGQARPVGFELLNNRAVLSAGVVGQRPAFNTLQGVDKGVEVPIVAGTVVGTVKTFLRELLVPQA